MSVYFIRAGRYFKIGLSDSPTRRFQLLHKGTARYTFPADAPWRVEDRELYRVLTDGDMGDERRIHLALDDFGVGLEWFLDEPELRAFIDALPDVAPEGYDYRKVERPGGWCAAEYDRVQWGRAEREILRRRAAA